MNTTTTIANVYLLIGSNLGNRAFYLKEARKHILSCGDIVNCSGIYETAAWGLKGQPAFYNQVLYLHTNLPAHILMQRLLKIEQQLGRVRDQKKITSRIIDIDILLYNNIILSDPLVTVPHPRMSQRRFVLKPLNEIAPDIIHPVFQKPISTLLQECTDELEVKKLQ